MTDINQSKIMILSTHGFEQSELEVPLKKLREAGAEVHVVAPESGEIKGWNDGNWGDAVKVDKTIDEASESDYHALVLPGGQINPDILRTHDNAVAMVRAFGNAGKPIAAICHGPWMLVEADLVTGRDVTSYPSIRTDMENAGGKWSDVDVAVDQAIITSRNPGDLDAFVSKIIEEVEEGKHERDAA
ncbi:type 1 glutamine amidotransferase domain-containing protein [Sulfitobacter sp. JB4-11]|uniref:type 1 glutamine amidotransferase domain-containing protein n=1 Tax=Sulfitobacter rhodophyticola TaxID=3238304 RepID=UPI00351417F3